MRLGLFREESTPPKGEDSWKVARNILVSSLNKGIIPEWEEFFSELPAMASANDLENVRSHFLRLTKWEFLQEMLKKTANEYYFHSTISSQRLSADGSKEKVDVPLEEEDWQLWLEVLSVHFKQNWNVQNPFVSFYAELFGKSYRLSLIHGSTSPLGRSKLMIRSISEGAFSLESFGHQEILKKMVSEKRNFVVAGPTGSGKTSLLSSLLEHIDDEEHLVILEDTYEIIGAHRYQTRMLAGESAQNSLKNYLTYSLRLSPDRIVLGEMRSHEVVPFLMAMNTGHKGLMGTVHASSAVDALNRVALLFSIYGGEANLHYDKVMELLCRNLEYVVYMEKKRVKEIIKILGSDKGVPFYDGL